MTWGLHCSWGNQVSKTVQDGLHRFPRALTRIPGQVSLKVVLSFGQDYTLHSLPSWGCNTGCRDDKPLCLVIIWDTHAYQPPWTDEITQFCRCRTTAQVLCSSVTAIEVAVWATKISGSSGYVTILMWFITVSVVHGVLQPHTLFVGFSQKSINRC